ncbi:MAG: glutaredoxin 3 [Acidobacteriota bacterium]|nr:MAG: glutaredoxin 3 [Acidobacteriota bacterium]
MAGVTVYVRSWCPWCRRALELLAAKGVRPEVIDIEREAERAGEMVRRAGGRTTVPQVFVGERHVGGFDDLAALDARGELDPLLASVHPSGDRTSE